MLVDGRGEYKKCPALPGIIVRLFLNLQDPGQPCSGINCMLFCEITPAGYSSPNPRVLFGIIFIREHTHHGRCVPPCWGFLQKTFSRFLPSVIWYDDRPKKVPTALFSVEARGAGTLLDNTTHRKKVVIPKPYFGSARPSHGILQKYRQIIIHQEKRENYKSPARLRI